jgi:cytochrome b
VSVTQATIAVARTIRPVPLAALLAATVGTNLLDFATIPAVGTRPDAGFALAAIVRIVAVFWVSYAVQRHLAGGAQPFRPSLALGRFVLLQLALLIGFGLATRLGLIVQGPGPNPLAARWLYAFLATTLYALLTIRLLAWNAALATDAPFGALGPVWRGQTGRLGAIAGGFVSLILPIAALHLAFTLVAAETVLSPEARLVVGVIDGVLQALQVALSCALGTVALRIARHTD